MANHRVPMGVFRSIAAGGDDDTDTLRTGQVSKRRLLLYAVHRRLQTACPELFVEGTLAAGWATLTRALRQNPAEVEEVLGHPAIGTWGMQLLRRLKAAELKDAAKEDAKQDAGYFGGIVAAALLRAGAAGEATVRVRADGTLVVPSVGRFDGLGPARWLIAVVQSGPSILSLVDEGRVVATTERADTRWLPIRRLVGSVGVSRIDLLLDDVDPFRAPDELPNDDRLSDDAVARWQAHLDAAWEVLVTYHPGRAAAIAQNVTAMAPLRGTESDGELSASSGESFGGIALTTPRHGDVLAEGLVHEYQHIKLWALLTLVPLVDLDDERLYYAPWRSDPRPARGLLQGAYAHLGLVQFWEKERRRRPSADGHRLHFEFARRRESVRVVLDTLTESGALTDAGIDFVAGMRQALTPLLAAPVPSLPAVLADDAERETHIGWRLRHLRVDPDVVRVLVDAWRAGRPCPAGGPIPAHPVRARRGTWNTGRQQLARRCLSAHDVPDPSHAKGLREADLAYANGEFATAAHLYADALLVTDAPVDAWTGVALANRHLRSPAAATLCAHPEVVRAIHDALIGESPRPVAIATWLHGRRLDRCE